MILNIALRYVRQVKIPTGGKMRYRESYGDKQRERQRRKKVEADQKSEKDDVKPENAEPRDKEKNAPQSKDQSVA